MMSKPGRAVTGRQCTSVHLEKAFPSAKIIFKRLASSGFHGPSLTPDFTVPAKCKGGIFAPTGAPSRGLWGGAGLEEVVSGERH